MKILLMVMVLFSMVSCIKKTQSFVNEQDQQGVLKQAKVVAETTIEAHVISKYEDSDAICYTVSKTQAISISCISKSSK